MKLRYLFCILFIFISLLTMLFADTNAIWHNVENILGDIFGQDEQDVTTSYTFINDVQFLSNVYLTESSGVFSNSLNGASIVDGKIRMVDVTENSDSDDTVVTKQYLESKLNNIIIN